jgi:four helix bundle protein
MFDVRRSGRGMVHAWHIAVVANTFQDLEAWRLADELKREVYALVATSPASKDFRFCNQIRESAASASRNIAEGFGRFRPGPFAQFMEIAIGSTMETQASLKDRVDRGYFTVKSIERASQLAQRCIQVSTTLLLYLKRCHKAERRTQNAERRT